MAFVPGFEYDVFISYSHVDNLTATPGALGWVDKFQKHLEVKLSKRFGIMGLVKIWRDETLDGAHLFDDVIENRISQSSIFLALNSQAYQKSEYCHKELDSFHRKAQLEKAGLIVGERTRIFNVLLNNIPHTEWPEQFGRATGFPFHDAKDEEQLGEPSEPGGKPFNAKLRVLADGVFQMLTALCQLVPTSPVAVKPIESPQDEECDVFVAEVADSLRLARKRLISQLTGKGIKVFEKIPPPYESKAHRESVVSAITRAKLSVHLLDHLGGAEIENENDNTYPRKQVELGLEHSPSQLIWVPRDLDVGNVEDEQYRAVLDKLENGARQEAAYDFVRGMPNDTTREILEKLEQLKSSSRASGIPPAALLDTHVKDQLLALEIGRFLLEKNIQPYVNPEEDDPTGNINILRQRLKQVAALIIFYGQVSEDWVRARLAEAVKIVISEGCPVRTFCIYLAPPAEAKADLHLEQPFLKVRLLDNRKGLNPRTFDQLLTDLGGGGV